MASKKTREEWLNAMAASLKPLFRKNGVKEFPKYRVTCGLPSRGAFAKNNRTIGQCWSDDCSKDKTFEIMISPTQDDSVKVAGILAHELVHAIVGIEAGHGKPFKDLAVAIGLEGKMTATTEGEAFKQYVSGIIKKIGKYPHAEMTANSGRKKQGTRLIKAQCSHCGYTVRTTRKWLEVATPVCPVDGEAMDCDEPEG